MSATQQNSKPSASDETANEPAKNEEVSEKKTSAKGTKEGRGGGGGGGKVKSGPRPRRSSGRQSTNNAQQRMAEACRMLRGWPTPSTKHLTALNEFFERTLKDNAVGLDELDRRSEFVRAIETDADAKLLRLHVIGPARSGFALRADESCVLIELLLTEESNSETDKAKQSSVETDKKGAKSKREQHDGEKTKSDAEKDDAEAINNDSEEADKGGKAKAKAAKARKAELVGRKRSALERIVDAATRRSCELMERNDEHVLVRERSGTTYRFRFAPLNNSAYVRTAVENAALLREYVALDPRCRSVGLLLAQLAVTLHLDALDDASRRGQQPPSSVRDQLAALTVYFFQKAKGTLPCLHELLLAEQKDKDKGTDKDAEVAKTNETKQHEEEQTADREGNEAEGAADKDKRKGGKEKFKRFGARESRHRQLVNVTEWQRNVVAELSAKWKKEREASIEAAGTKVGQESIAELFLALLSFIALDLDPLATVVSLASSRAVARRADRRGWSSFEAAGYLFVEDASRPTANVCLALRTPDAWRALNYRMIAAFRYFATPVVLRPSTDDKTPAAPTRLFDFVKVEAVLELPAADSNAGADAEAKTSENAVTEKGDSAEQKAGQNVSAAKDDAAEKPDDETAKKDEDSAAAAKQNGGAPKRRRERERDHTRRTVVRRTIVDSAEPGWYSTKLLETLQNDNSVSLVYEWLAETVLSHFPVVALRPSVKLTVMTAAATITPAAAATAVAGAAGTTATSAPAAADASERETNRRGCEVCHREHPESAAECPIAKRCSLEPTALRKVNRNFAWYVSELMCTLQERCEPTDREIELKQTVIDNVFEILARNVHPNTRVDVYGSCANGFEYRGSDMDLCVTFGEIKETPTRSWQVERLRKFADILRRSPVPFRVVKLIETARVPIIKFRHMPTNVLGDVCLYNLLALENTSLMRTYSKIDSRVPVLGTMLKSLVKQMHINDASKRTLSSYAYLNMLVYFLQHCSPPVLPVLQELYDGAPSKKGKQQTSTAAPQRIVDGKNVWFQSNMEHINAHFKVAENSKTFGELWIEFLHYYAHKFNFKDLVVSIRQWKPLKKSEKNWTHGRGLCFAIEDPFEVEHNLGDVLAPDTMARIIGVFRAAYQQFTDETKFTEALKEKEKKDFRELRSHFFKLSVAPVAEALNTKVAKPKAKANANAAAPAEKDKSHAERERGTARGEREPREAREPREHREPREQREPREPREQRERRPRRPRGKKEKDGAAKQQGNAANGESKRDADERDDDVRIGARNDADENDAFDSAESSPKKSSN